MWQRIDTVYCSTDGTPLPIFPPKDCKMSQFAAVMTIKVVQAQPAATIFIKDFAGELLLFFY